MESLFYRPSVTSVRSLILGWPYKPERNVKAHSIDTYNSPWDVIIDPSVDTIQASQVIYPYYLNVRGLYNENGVIVRSDRGFDPDIQMWWVSYRSGATFSLQHKDLELIDINPESDRIMTGCLYRIVTLPGFYVNEVSYDGESKLWVYKGKKIKLSTGTLVAPTDYYSSADLVKKDFYPRVFVNYTTMQMFVMNYAVRLVPDFRGRVPDCFIRFSTPKPDSETKES